MAKTPIIQKVTTDWKAFPSPDDVAEVVETEVVETEIDETVVEEPVSE